MSNISTAYDAIRTAISTNFATKTELSNPYDLEANINNLLVNGYALRVDSMSPSDIDILKESNVNQTFTIIFTSEMPRTDGDTSIIHTTVKALLENEVTLRLDLLNADQIGQLAAIDKIEFSNRSAIQPLRVGKQNFIYIESTFSFDLAENI